MKRILFFSLFLVSLHAFDARSQCSTTSFPYIFCTSQTTFIFRCSANPSIEGADRMIEVPGNITVQPFTDLDGHTAPSGSPIQMPQSSNGGPFSPGFDDESFENGTGTPVTCQLNNQPLCCFDQTLPCGDADDCDEQPDGTDPCPDWGDEESTWQTWHDNEVGVSFANIYDDGQAQTDATNALIAWQNETSKCGYPIDQNCTITVEWVSSEADFQRLIDGLQKDDCTDQITLSNTLAIQGSYPPCNSSNTHGSPCGPVIFMNATQDLEWRGNQSIFEPGGGTPNNWYGTFDGNNCFVPGFNPMQFVYTPSSPSSLVSNYWEMSFFTNMEHEIGHILGLLHPCAVKACAFTDPTVMQEAIPGASPLNLTSVDQCMIAKLYCGPASSVAENSEEEENIEPTIYPNPTTGTCQVSYNVKESSYVAISIYDVMGRDISDEFSGYEEQGSYTISLGTDGLPSGHYVCRVTVGEVATYLDFVIKK
jgi:hypothetical protein